MSGQKNKSKPKNIPGERRKHKRIGTSAVMVFRPLDTSLMKPGATHYLPGDSLNLSLGGVLFTANIHMEAGTRIKIRLRLFDVFSDDPRAKFEEIAGVSDLVATAFVTRVEDNPKGGYRYAASFDSFVEGDTKKLQSFIESL
jgi:hypothetical protein